MERYDAGIRTDRNSLSRTAVPFDFNCQAMSSLDGKTEHVAVDAAGRGCRRRILNRDRSALCGASLASSTPVSETRRAVRPLVSRLCGFGHAGDLKNVDSLAFAGALST